jgi:large subunit ribosomal protein L28
MVRIATPFVARVQGIWTEVLASGRSPILGAMPKICHVCAKGPAFGNNRSHSMVATRRRFDPNLQRVRIDDGGTPRRVYVCTRCLKAGKITKAR